MSETAVKELVKSTAPDARDLACVSKHRPNCECTGEFRGPIKA